MISVRLFIIYIFIFALLEGIANADPSGSISQMDGNLTVNAPSDGFLVMEASKAVHVKTDLYLDGALHHSGGSVGGGGSGRFGDPSATVILEMGPGKEFGTLNEVFDELKKHVVRSNVDVNIVYGEYYPANIGETNADVKNFQPLGHVKILCGGNNVIFNSQNSGMAMTFTRVTNVEFVGCTWKNGDAGNSRMMWIDKGSEITLLGCKAENYEKLFQVVGHSYLK
eukprot:Nk52_evm1s47 gene=Nk52_evmTU1s47